MPSFCNGRLKKGRMYLFETCLDSRIIKIMCPKMNPNACPTNWHVACQATFSLEIAIVYNTSHMIEIENGLVVSAQLYIG